MLFFVDKIMRNPDKENFEKFNDFLFKRQCNVTTFQPDTFQHGSITAYTEQSESPELRQTNAYSSCPLDSRFVRSVVENFCRVLRRNEWSWQVERTPITSSEQTHRESCKKCLRVRKRLWQRALLGEWEEGRYWKERCKRAQSMCVRVCLCLSLSFS